MLRCILTRAEAYEWKASRRSHSPPLCSCSIIAAVAAILVAEADARGESDRVVGDFDMINNAQGEIELFIYLFDCLIVCFVYDHSKSLQSIDYCFIITYLCLSI